MSSTRFLALRLGACLAFAATCAIGADAPVPAPAVTAEAPAKGPSATAFLAEEEKWNFTPPVGRPDIFYDREMMLSVEQQIKGTIVKDEQGPLTPDKPIDDPIDQAKVEIARIETYMSQRKWEEAIKIADAATKKLGAITGNVDLTRYIGIIKGYRDQADDALVRDKAQAAFDALNLKVEGIMWSENGSRLALIHGEPKALGVNDRVKDCVIINIDTDRVDFRFHFNRKRFEFPRYVGEDAKSK